MRLLGCTLNPRFLLVVSQIGPCKSNGWRNPRVHDLRHYPTIQTLLRWHRADVDLLVHLQEFGAYRRHVHVRHTFWYLSSVPELLKLSTPQRGSGVRP
jgi:integrase/recombinase XerD